MALSANTSDRKQACSSISSHIHISISSHIIRNVKVKRNSVRRSRLSYWRLLVVILTVLLLNTHVISGVTQNGPVTAATKGKSNSKSGNKARPMNAKKTAPRLVTAGAPMMTDGDDDDRAVLVSGSVGDDELALLKHYKQLSDRLSSTTSTTTGTTSSTTTKGTSFETPPLIINLGQGTTGTHGVYDLQCRMGIQAMHLERYCLSNAPRNSTATAAIRSISSSSNSSNSISSGNGGGDRGAQSRHHHWQRLNGMKHPLTGNKFGRFEQMTYLVDWTARSLYMRARNCVLHRTNRISSSSSSGYNDSSIESGSNNRSIDDTVGSSSSSGHSISSSIGGSSSSSSSSKCDAIRWRNEMAQRIAYSMVHRGIRAFNDIPYFGFLQLLLQLNKQHFPDRAVKFVVTVRNPEKWHQRRTEKGRHSFVCRYETQLPLADFTGCIEEALRRRNISDPAPLSELPQLQSVEAVAEASAVLDTSHSAKEETEETEKAVSLLSASSTVTAVARTTTAELSLADVFEDYAAGNKKERTKMMYEYQDVQVYRLMQNYFRSIGRNASFGVDYLVTNYFDEIVSAATTTATSGGEQLPVVNQQQTSVEQKLRAFMM